MHVLLYRSLGFLGKKLGGRNCKLLKTVDWPRFVGCEGIDERIGAKIGAWLQAADGTIVCVRLLGIEPGIPGEYVGENPRADNGRLSSTNHLSPTMLGCWEAEGREFVMQTIGGSIGVFFCH